MTAPTATYRLQFRDGMTFERAAALSGYLARLGISHLYASPIFEATVGSEHGYDGIDFSSIEPAIGGERGFDRLTKALRDAGLELILDFVPNHMAAAEGNSWWRSVLEWGTVSPYAAFFDIDWAAPRLLLPILGASYSEALQENAFGIAFDRTAGEFLFTCYDRRLPLTPPSYAGLLSQVDHDRVAQLASRFAASTIAGADSLKEELAALAGQDDCRNAIAAMVTAASGDRDFLDRLHQAQIWRLAHWRLAREELTYRRFFEISELVCLRVEDPVVFDAVHARLLRMIRNGGIAGVRLDHIDGLADPKGYLERLQGKVSADAPFYLLVEKILERDERLPADWPVAGTTGYEFISLVADLLVDRRHEDAMTKAYVDFVGESQDYATAARSVKQHVFSHNLAAELRYLTSLAQKIATRGHPELPTDASQNAIVALAAALSVYRTYVDEAGPSARDRALIEAAARDARETLSALDRDAVDFLGRVLTLEPDPAIERNDAIAFTTRFQQTTGPVMAKGIEDTMFYRYNRLIALNEVGGAPDRYGAEPSDFHAAMADRTKRPGGLSASATHDTKRGEDARARLYVLSETPDQWRTAVARWAARNAAHRTHLLEGPAPEPAQEWAFYQALLGAWPAELVRDDWQESGTTLNLLRQRMVAYMVKAVREAKDRTSWTDPDLDYERAVSAFVSAVLSKTKGDAFLEDFVETCSPVWIAGAINSLTQLAIKLLAPGVPDFYQGAELWDFSLVDPDNRRAVDFDARQRLLTSVSEMTSDQLLDRWRSGAPKLALTVAGLRLRAAAPSLFADGAYIPLSAKGPAAHHVVAFARHLEDATVVAILPRFVLGLTNAFDRPLVAVDHWKDTKVVLPRELRAPRMRDVVTGEVHIVHRELSVAAILHCFPVAVLISAL